MWWGLVQGSKLPEPKDPSCDTPKEQSIGDREEPEHRKQQQAKASLEVPGGVVVAMGAL